MFKKIMGFDTDLLKFGAAVKIEDSETGEKPRGAMAVDDGLNHKWENKKGTYLVKESSSTVLRLTDSLGDETKFHIRHFIGMQPRMILTILN